MSSAFCSLEEAFAGPVMPMKKKKDKNRSKEGFVPGPLSGMPDTLNTEPMVPAPMGPPQESGNRPDAAVALNDFFPLPGETAEPEEWAKAFTLEGSNMPMPRPDGSVSVAGKSTLWRQVPAPAPAPSPMMKHTQNAPVHGSIDIYQRLDTLAQQLETLTTSTPMQSTAELFLFIAIGLLFLLAIDTLLRCATSIALATTSKQGGGVRLGRRRWK
jgi:hypothetical protein